MSEKSIIEANLDYWNSLFRSFYPVELNSNPLIASVEHTGKLIELHQNIMKASANNFDNIVTITREMLNIYYMGWQQCLDFEEYIDRLNSFIRITNGFVSERQEEMLSDLEKTQKIYLTTLNELYSNNYELNKNIVDKWVQMLTTERN